LDAEEMDKIIKGQGLGEEKDQNKVRDWDTEKHGGAMVQF
jgi:hypothetical protein